jgi:hypothetical protein
MMGKLSEEWNTGILGFDKKKMFFPLFPVCRQAGIIPTFHYSKSSIPSFQLSTIPLY